MQTFPTTAQRYATDRLSIVREKDYRHTHDVLHGPPCLWSLERGATHTLVVPRADHNGQLQTRPAKLYKTVLVVGVDETPDGGIQWERWSISRIAECEPGTATPPQVR